VWRRLFRLGTRRWFASGSQQWAVLAIVSGGMLLWRRITGRTEEIVHREVLEPGTTLIVSAPAPAAEAG